MKNLFNKMAGYGQVDGNIDDKIKDYLIEGEEILRSFQFIRDGIVITNKGLYMIDVQGLTGKKVEVKFYKSRNIKSISFETAGDFDLDVDIKIFVDGNYVLNQTGGYANAPITFKVPKAQSEEAKEVVKIIKMMD